MSWGSLSQFSPNFEQPMPTMATLSRMAWGFMAISSAHRRALPVVVRRPAGVVHLPEDQLHRKVELHLLRARVGHLEIEAGALPVHPPAAERGGRGPPPACGRGRTSGAP